MAFKMKGSPMQRNFGIGSPMKQEEEKKINAKVTHFKGQEIDDIDSNELSIDGVIISDDVQKSKYRDPRSEQLFINEFFERSQEFSDEDLADPDFKRLMGYTGGGRKEKEWKRK